MVNVGYLIDSKLHITIRTPEIFLDGGDDYHTQKGSYNLKIFLNFGLKGKEEIIKSIKNEISNSRTH